MEGSIESLLAVDAAGLSHDARLDRLVALQVVAARVAAASERTLATLGLPDDPKNYAREEVGCALRWSFSYTQARLAQARKLVTDLPGTLALHEAGELSADHVRAIVDRSYQLDQKTTAKLEEQVLDRAPDQTVTEFGASVTRAVHRVDPRGADQRHVEARRTRGVFPRVLPDGMAAIWSIHDAITVEAIMNRLRARSATTGMSATTGPDDDRCADDRCADERRADALAELILGGLSQEHSSTSPTSALKDFILARDRTCRLPGCNRQATTCELDHLDPWNGTNTPATTSTPSAPATTTSKPRPVGR